jgi:hypothetical protein
MILLFHKQEPQFANSFFGLCHILLLLLLSLLYLLDQINIRKREGI